MNKKFNELHSEIERLRETIANAAQLNARLMDIIDLAKRMKTAAFNHWCEKTPETNGILVDLQFEFEDALEGLKKDGHWTVGKGKSRQPSINDGGVAKDEMSEMQSGKKKRE
jgi:hypothetical protein